MDKLPWIGLGIFIGFFLWPILKALATLVFTIFVVAIILFAIGFAIYIFSGFNRRSQA